MIYTGLSRTGEIVNVKVHGGGDISEVYGGIRETSPIYYKSRTLTGTLPLNFKALGKPLSDYLISGNTIQNGTPTPDAPVEVVGVGEKTGNLFDKSKITTGFAYFSGISPNASYYCSDFIPITATTYYFQNVVGSNSQNSVVVYDTNKQGLRYEKISGGNKVSGAITFRSGDAYIRVNCVHQTDVDTVMVKEGSSPPDPYEPYGYKLPLTINGTEYSIYLGQVETTRRIKKLVLTGDETIGRESAYARFSFYILDMRGAGVRLTRLYCTHYQNISDGRPVSDIPNNSIYTGGGSDAQKIFIKTTDYTTVEDFKSYLAAQYAAGTPVTIWYILATEKIGVVNEPLHKIGSYTDTITMAQAGEVIPTTIGTNTLTVGTTVQPSSMSITGNIKSN